MDRLALLHQLATKVRLDRQRAALATVTGTSGSTPQRAGAKMVLFEDGTRLGTIGGGAIEECIEHELLACISSTRPQSVTRNLTRDLAMCCGGTMSVFIEPFLPPPRLVCFGAGHIARPCAQIAKTAGFEVVIIDAREELNNSESFPDCSLLLSEGDDLLKSGKLALGPEDYVLVCTHSHQLDEKLIGLCAKETTQFLGMIGSQRKSEVIRQRLRLKVPELDTSHLVSPVGIAIGALEPEEIAVSIVAQLIAARRASNGAAPVISDGPLFGVILAAGGASRLGNNKALGWAGDRTVIESVHSTLLEAGCREVCVVVAPPHSDEIMDAHPGYWYEPTSKDGDMSTSFRAGYLAARARGASKIVLATLDQPFVKARTIRSLVACLDEGAVGVVPACDGKRGHPIVLSGELELPPRRDSEVLRDLIRTVFSPREFQVDDRTILDNLNTKEDARRLNVRLPDDGNAPHLE